MNVTIDISAQRIADMMCGASECNFMTVAWCWGIRLGGALEGKEHEFKTSEGYPWYCNPALYKREDFQMTVWEIEDEGDEIEEDLRTGLPLSNVKAHTITRETIANGLKIMSTKYPWHFADIMQENDDAITADVFLQLISLGELVYG